MLRDTLNITYYTYKVKGLLRADEGTRPHIQTTLLLEVTHRNGVLTAPQLDGGLREVERHLVTTHLHVTGGTGDGNRGVSDHRGGEKQ